MLKKLVATSLISSTLVLGGLAPMASAVTIQDGLVNVNVGDITIEDAVDLGVAANVAAEICGVDVGPLALAVLGQAVAVDRSGRTRTICTTDQGPVTISQN